MTTQPPSPEAVEAANLKWEIDTEVIGICKFPCVRNRNGVGVILTGQPETEVQQLAHLHNQAIDLLAAEVERLRAQAYAVCEWRPQGQDGENGYMANCGQWWHWHFKMTSKFCPGCGRKVKIQPQTDEQ